VSKADAQVSATQSRIKVEQQSNVASFMNGQRVELLEPQISEIIASSREEARDVKLKISACLASIESRQREQSAQIAICESELSSRQMTYDAHIKQMEKQFAMEKRRLEQAVAAEAAKLESLGKVTQQLDATQRKWRQMSARGIDKQKTALNHIRSQVGKEFEQTREAVSGTGEKSPTKPPWWTRRLQNWKTKMPRCVGSSRSSTRGCTGDRRRPSLPAALGNVSVNR
jgi:hypothetical protein